MLDLNLENILSNVFYIDIKKNKINKDISQIAILTIKSLMPSINEVGNRIDYKRFHEELRLWRYYRTGENNSLLNILDKPDRDIYFNFKDETIYSRIIPIILANKKYEIIEDEIIKNILFTTGNIENLLEWLLIGRTLSLVLENKDYTMEELKDSLKEYVINFSQVDFLKQYGNLYRFDIGRASNYKIVFERTRLDLLNLLNGANLNKYIFMEDILGILEGNTPKTFLGDIIYVSTQDLAVESELNNFYISMNKYVLRLRKSRIKPEELEIKEYILPDIFIYEEGEVFFHSLLKEVKVIKKEVKDGVLTSLVQTRSGMYLFKRDPV